MIINFPTPSGPYSTALLSTILRAVSQAFNRAMPTDEPVSSFILLSPNGTRYRVTVSDAGVLTTTAI